MQPLFSLFDLLFTLSQPGLSLPFCASTNPALPSLIFLPVFDSNLVQQTGWCPDWLSLTTQADTNRDGGFLLWTWHFSSANWQQWFVQTCTWRNFFQNTHWYGRKLWTHTCHRRGTDEILCQLSEAFFSPPITSSGWWRETESVTTPTLLSTSSYSCQCHLIAEVIR